MSNETMTPEAREAMEKTNQEAGVGGRATMAQILAAHGVTVKTATTQGGNQKKIKPALPAPKIAALVGANFEVRKTAVFRILKPEERQAQLEKLAGFESEIAPRMHDLVAEERAYERISPCDRDKMDFKEGHEANQAEILGYLNRPGSLGATALVAYADASIRHCPEISSVLRKTRDDLMKKGFLQAVSPASRGAVKVAGEFVGLVDEYSRIPGAKGILETLENLVSRTQAAGKKLFEESLEAIKAAEGENPLTVAEIEEATEETYGRRIIPIPDQSGYRRDGTPFFYRGGPLLVEMAKGYITPLAGAGGAHRLIEKTGIGGVSLPIEQLCKERLDFVGERIPDEEFWVLKTLHRVLRLGLVEAKKEEERVKNREAFKEKVDAERVALASKATLTPTEAYVAKAPGFSLLDWGAKFEERTGQRDKMGKPITRTVWFLLALWERNAAGQIRVAECPERLKEFFSPYRQFADPGENYSNLGVLGVLLRREATRAELGATPEEQVAAAETKAAADKAAAETKAEAKAAADRQLAAELLAGSGEELTADTAVPSTPTAVESGVEEKRPKRISARPPRRQKAV